MIFVVINVVVINQVVVLVIVARYKCVFYLLKYIYKSHKTQWL